MENTITIFIIAMIVLAIMGAIAPDKKRNSKSNYDRQRKNTNFKNYKYNNKSINIDKPKEYDMYPYKIRETEPSKIDNYSNKNKTYNNYQYEAKETGTLKVELSELDKLIENDAKDYIYKPKEYNKNYQYEAKETGTIKIDNYSNNKTKENNINEIKINKGKDYEIYIGNYYENKGYDVKYLGVERGLQDNGIDLIARKENEVLFIQCKNWHKNSKYKIGHKDIKAFIGEVSMFLDSNEEFKNTINQSIFIVSDRETIDASAKAYCNNKKNIRIEEHKIRQLTTYNLAKKYNTTTKKMEMLLIENGYLEQRTKGLYLTEKGKNFGEWQKGEGRGYFLWNENIYINLQN